MIATSTDWIRHPGSYIKEEMEARGWLQRDLAFILGCSEQSLNTILSGKRGITPDMAKAMEEAFDVPAEFFLNLQQAFDLTRAKNPYTGVSERRVMQEIYPVREMIKRGWMIQSEAAMLESQLVRYFGVKSSEEIPYMEHAAKKSGYEERDISPPQLAWLFRVRQIARSITVPRYSEKALRNAASDMEAFLVAPEETRHVPRLMAECGVRYIVVEKLTNAKIDGVAFWLDSRSPVIGMSLQHDRIDNFWFVLRHEIEHILRRHGRAQEVIDTDLEGNSGSSEEELVANAAASNFCVPSESLDSFIRRKHPFFYEKDVIAFSRRLNRHPGVVIGQLRRRLNRYDYLTRHLAKVRQFVLPGSIADGWGQVIPASL